jgi:hypothetical protein
MPNMNELTAGVQSLHGMLRLPEYTPNAAWRWSKSTGVLEEISVDVPDVEA